MQATNEQLRDLLVHLDKIHSVLTNTVIKDIDNIKDLNRINNDWRNFVVKLMNSETKNHPTEEKYPEQTKRFREILDELYQTHLQKNADYSKWNVLGVGIVGIGTRFWDKTCRILNLIGFDITTGEYSGPKKNLVEDEKLEDTFRDASVYGIIARIYLEGKWGK